VVAIAFMVTNSAAAQVETVQVREDFARDPDWEARNNLPDPSTCVTKTQDFGYSRSRHAGGEPGEIGGRVSRSVTPAVYAMPIRPRSLQQRLRASGRFSVTQSEGGSGVLVGWFNQTSRGWRTPNSLVFRIDGESDRFRVFFEYGTQTWKTGGGRTFEGRYQVTKTPLHRADGTPHTWSLDYEPAGADGAGEITYTLDGKKYTARLGPGHKGEGAVFDRFGIMNVQMSGDGITVWLDDLVIDGVKQDFAADPGWEGKGNRATFRDCVRRPYHDFGYRQTDRAGGEPGEIGGIVWRIESINPQNAGYYGTPVGRLSLNDELRASGKISLHQAAADSAVLIGWFNAHTPIGAPPDNFLGLLVEGPSRIGHYVRPAWASSDDQREIMSTGPIIRPDDASHDWTLHYDPNADTGRGVITMSLDGQTITMPLSELARKGNAAFNRFGLVTWHRGGHFVDIYFDDLSFTARKPEDR
jgi:hypothetical protein